MAFGIDISGIPRLEKRLKDIENSISVQLAEELSASSFTIEKQAKRNAPVNMGTLRQSIHATSKDKLTHYVEAGASYAPYIEFGTGGKVKVQAGYEEYAASFKNNKGGSLEDMIQALTLWVKRKGLAGTYSVKTQRRLGGKGVKQSQDEKLARFLAIKILKNGIKPQPFLIPAFEQEKPKLIERLKKILNAKS
jgi:HK97 gp10 family phage protein